MEKVVMNPSGSVRFLCVAAAVCLSLSCTGPLSRNHGQIIPDAEVTRQFESYQVNPDYRYYITGSAGKPEAFLGIDRHYRIDPATLWKEVSMTPELMKQYIDWLHGAYLRINTYHGFIIRDEKERPIGVWYSPLGKTTFVQTLPDGTLRIDTPFEKTVYP